jgi:protein involved in polysaccharide export with SLBB domain
MIAKRILPLAVSFFLWGMTLSRAAEPIAPNANATPKPLLSPQPAASTYVLSPNDLVLIKVYRHDDLESRLRIGKDGSSIFPLLGTVQLGGKTIEQATTAIREQLAKDYLVNPQVTVTVLDYAKRRFTVLGQVLKPGSYEIPSEESVNLLEAVAIAGGFTRLSNTSKITVARMNGDKRTVFTLDVAAANKDSEFQIQPDDTINIPQRLF